MAYTEAGPSASRASRRSSGNESLAANGNYRQRVAAEPQFDILEWYPHFQSSHRYFFEVAQHSSPVQSLAAFINILLPCQKHPVSGTASADSSPRSGPSMPRQATSYFSGSSVNANPQMASVIPYIRRLVASGFDNPAVLHGFFGDEWASGIGPLHEMERRNYLFSAKSGSWLDVKKAYDMSPSESIPYMKPLQNATEKEILAAESNWSDWLAMQDWMVGPRAPDIMSSSSRVQSPRVKREPRE